MVDALTRVLTGVLFGAIGPGRLAVRSSERSTMPHHDGDDGQLTTAKAGAAPARNRD